MAVRLGARSNPQDTVEQVGERNFRLAGDYVAFERFDAGQGGADYNVEVVNLRTRRRLHHVPTGPIPSDANFAGGFSGGSSGTGPTTALVLNPHGSVAWIVRDVYAAGRSYQVHKDDHAGPALLDEGSAIDPRALTAAGGVVSWIDAGQRRTAPLS